MIVVIDVVVVVVDYTIAAILMEMENGNGRWLLVADVVRREWKGEEEKYRTDGQTNAKKD